MADEGEIKLPTNFKKTKSLFVALCVTLSNRGKNLNLNRMLKLKI